MAGLITTLSAASSALSAQSTAINVTGNNIANVNNPNYSREEAVVTETGEVETANGAESTGVSVSVQQDRDSVLDAMVRQESSLVSGFTAQQSLLQSAQAALGENITDTSTSTTSSSSDSTTSDSGLSAAIDNFFDAFQDVAANPTDTGDAQTLVQQAGVLSDRFQEIDQSLSEVQSNGDASVASGVQSANQLLSQIAQLNGQIQAAEAGSPGSAVDLRDERAGDLQTLSGLVPITATEDATGQVSVTTTDTSGNAVSLVSKNSVANSLSYANGELSAGSTQLGVSSGSLQGTITASTGAVQTLRDNLNALANQIVTSVNAAYNSTNSATGNFFAASGTTAGTIAVDSNLNASTLVVGTGAVGDNSIAVAVSNVANQQFSTGSGDAITGTISEAYAADVSGIGEALDTANTQVTDQTNVQTIVTNQQQAVSGVSLDEEMSNLMTYQRAYQASSEVMQVVSDLLNTLIQSVN